MRQPASRELFNRWNHLRGVRSAPDRSLLNPAILQGIIGETFMLEADVAGSFPVLIAGSQCEALFTNSLRGRSFVELWPAHERRQIAALCACVMDGCVPIVAGVTAAPQDRQPLALEMLLLPLRHNGRTHSRILGCLQTQTHPSWLGLLPIENLCLTSLRILSVENSEKLSQEILDPPRRASEKARYSIPHAAKNGAQLVLHNGGRDN